MPLPRRVLALDVGSRRIGVAVSDPLGITAQGLETIQRQNKRKDWDALGAVLKKYDVGEIVVGLPLRLSGAEGTQSEKMRAFAGELHAKFGLPVHLWDERLTTREAHRILYEAGHPRQNHRRVVDQVAATLILGIAPGEVLRAAETGAHTLQAPPMQTATPGFTAAQQSGP